VIMCDSDNERLVMRFFLTLSKGDLEGVRALLHDDACWSAQVRDVPGAGAHRGKDEIVDKFLAPVRGLFVAGDPKLQINTMGSKGAFVFAETRGVGRLADGRTYDNRYAWAIELSGNKILEIREYMDSHYVMKLLGS